MPVLAVGAAFAFIAGEMARAPEFMQRNGLEWVFRLMQEPCRSLAPLSSAQSLLSFSVGRAVCGDAIFHLREQASKRLRYG